MNTRWLGLSAPLVAAVLGLGLASRASAAVVASNLGEADSSNFAGISSLSKGSAFWAAESITTGAGNWQINSLTLRLSESSTNNPDALAVDICSDNAGAPGASILGSFNTSTSNVGSPFANQTYAPTASLQLSGNTTYWVVIRYTAAPAFYGWRLTNSANDNGVSGWSIGNSSYASTTSGASWGYAAGGQGLNRPAMLAVDATSVLGAVPLPTAAMAALPMAAGLLARRRRSI